MKNKEFNVRMSVSLTADPKLVSRTKLNPLKLAKSTEPRGYLLFCRANTYVFTAMQYCIEKATAISFFSLVNQQQQYQPVSNYLRECVTVLLMLLLVKYLCLMEEIFVIPPPELH